MVKVLVLALIDFYHDCFQWHLPVIIKRPS